MKVAHLLRKYNPAEWGGTETSVQHLLDGLARQQVERMVFAPRLAAEPSEDPLRAAGHRLVRYSAFLPVLGIPPKQRRQLVAIGGNLMSFDLPWKLLREPGLSLIHTHTLNRLGGIALRVAQCRSIPLVVTIHGGVLDLPEAVRLKLAEPLQGGFEWGKLFGLLLASRKLLSRAHAILTCNRREAALLDQTYPGKIVVALPHSVPRARFEQDERPALRRRFPELAQRPFLLVLGRIDPVKNQLWAVRHFPALRKEFPGLMLVLAGACTDEAYGKMLKKEIRHAGLEGDVRLTGNVPQQDPALIGLLQAAQALVVPSHSETFGLVVIEAWAAGTPVLTTRTSGTLDLVEEGETGCFFDLERPGAWIESVSALLSRPDWRARLVAAGQARVRLHHDAEQIAGRVRQLYARLLDRPA